MKKLTLAALALAVFCSSCDKKYAEPELFLESAFDKTINGGKVSLYTLTNKNGMAVQITNYGARIVDLWAPAADGSFRDVVMGFETIDNYLNAKDINNGPVVGRYGNRIGKGRFTLDSTQYQLTLNERDNHLHGGTGGFGSRVWEVIDSSPSSILLGYISPDGEDGYPGELRINVTYQLTDDNSLKITYEASTDAPTILNPTSHSYFNLHGTNSRSTDSHILTINADSFTPTDSELIPTGEIAPVAGTPMDFRAPHAIGERVGTKGYQPIEYGGGYDHNWAISKKKGPGEVEEVAEVYEPSTGIVMKILTDQPGLQFYSGNFMDGKEKGKRGNKNEYRSGIALETQNFPDAPNQSNFPSAVLRPGKVYHHICIYQFSTKK